MKTKSIIYKILLLLILLASCKEQPNKVDEILKGNHELRKFKTITQEGYSWNAGYFLIAGKGSGSSYKDIKASFSWKMNTGEYEISEIELSKIRVRIDNTVTTPYITFNWDYGRITNLEHILLSYVNYITITCKEEDYPVNIKITDL